MTTIENRRTSSTNSNTDAAATRAAARAAAAAKTKAARAAKAKANRAAAAAKAAQAKAAQAAAEAAEAAAAAEAAITNNIAGAAEAARAARATLVAEPEPVIETEAELLVEAEPEPAPEPTVEPELVVEPEPELVEPELVVEPEPEPELMIEPELVVEPEPEPTVEPEPELVIEPELIIEPELVVEPELVAEPEPVFEPESMDEAPTVFAARTLASAPAITHLAPTIVLEPPDPDFLARTMREIEDFAARNPEARTRTAELVTVFSPKGGTGTTFVATNLALALTAGGQRRVCLLDLDLEFGDVAITAGLAPNRSIADAIGLDLQSESAIEALVTPGAPGLDCILAPIDPGVADGVTASIVKALVARLRGSYDYLVVDTPSQLSELVLEALESAEHHVLVTSPEIAALKNLRITLDTLDLLAFTRAARHVVLNRWDAKRGLGPAEVAAAVRHQIDAVVPDGADVSRSVEAGALLLGTHPDSPVSVAVRQFVDVTFMNMPAAPGRHRQRGARRSRKASV